MTTPTLEQRWADLFAMIERAQADIPGASEQALVAVRFIAENLHQAYAPPAAPRPASAALSGLIAQWREQSRCASHFSEWHPRAAEDLKQMAEGQAYAFGECANDLAAALARADQP